MMNTRCNKMIALVMTTLFVACSADISVTDTETENNSPVENDPHDSSLYVQPIENLNSDFIKGADISTLLQVEESGGVFYDEDGNPADAIQVLAEHGVNWVRLRLWNDPYDVSWIQDVTGFEVQGATGAGTNDLPRTIEMAKRAKAAGLNILLDFHYSDFWAHPGQQYMPDAWVGLSQQEVEQALYDFTYDTLMAMENEDVFPQMVQIGNEINSGLVAPQGDGLTSQNAIALLKQGSQAVRDAQAAVGKSSKIMIHLADGGNNGTFVWAFDAFTQANLDYDIIGLSYYPYWHGTLAELQFNLDDISAKYNKEVIVVETAHGFTVEQGPDEGGNIFNSDSALAAGFAATVQGQATAMREIMNVVAQVPADLGRGIFYWEPAWLGVQGAGWVTGANNGWENQAMFAYNGQVLDSMDVFWKVSQDTSVEAPTLVSLLEADIEFEQGDDLVLPNQVFTLYSDDSYRHVNVSWSNASSISTNTAGEFDLVGSTIERGEPVTAKVTVTEKVVDENQSILQNFDFESGQLEPWVISAGTAGLALADKAADAYSGQYALHFWSTSAQSQSAKQIQTNVPNGRYKISAWIMGESSAQSASKLTATSGNTTMDSDIVFAGWANWVQVELELEVINNQLSVTVDIEEAVDSWGNIDNIQAELISPAG
ncbi:glycosyl hydrolase 53 family protein [Catenovulum sediminis]|uniref:Arabinogalactan endo-beta-1,4-galactanase n=1 Tax=Catenovulum sediminis TaxID=1740262 RepID=A0ABV1RHH3_9ALTE